jgi:hypothetical protein
MKWHCGLLSERPDQDRTLQWIKRGGWGTGLPADVERELKIWLAMPGFTIKYHAHVFRLDRSTIAPFVGRGFEELKQEVAENWLSVTRDDAVKLSQIRPPKGDVPLISQLAIADDVKRGVKKADIQRAYKVSGFTVTSIAKGHLRVRSPLPSGFELLVPTEKIFERA